MVTFHQLAAIIESLNLGIHDISCEPLPKISQEKLKKSKINIKKSLGKEREQKIGKKMISNLVSDGTDDMELKSDSELSESEEVNSTIKMKDSKINSKNFYRAIC
jgi:hypothetical protein